MWDLFRRRFVHVYVLLSLGVVGEYVAKIYLDCDRALLVMRSGAVVNLPRRGFVEGSPEAVRTLFLSAKKPA